MANHDYLTGLPNRSLFNLSLKNATAKVKRTKLGLALMYLDIDHFKQINDSMGHDTGDKLLVAFSSRLKRCVRRYDVAARLGGDEFVLLLTDLKEQKDVILIAEKILSNAQKPFILNKKNIAITTSIGISFYNGSDIEPLEFVKQADEALYNVKKAGRNNYKIFKGYS